MNAVERFHAVLNFEAVDRLPHIEWAAWWDETLERWKQEGLPADDGGDNYISHFGLDNCRKVWVTPRGEFGQFRKPDTSRYDGVISIESDYEPIQALIAGPLKLDKEYLQQIAAEQKAGTTIFWLALDGFFWFPREVFGIEQHLMAFYDTPQLMHQINQDILDYNQRVLAAVTRIVKPDLVVIGEDMSYNHGPMCSADMFQEFLAPYYKELIPQIQEIGSHIFVDSDGDITPLIPWFQGVGIEGILPLERMAGVDVNAIRAEYPQWKMIGGYDKTVMHLGETAMRNEFERLLPAMQSGGYIPSVDHQTPPGVSCSQYREYTELLFEYCAKV